jgi:tetratricopeptide (TPR) repeat protein
VTSPRHLAWRSNAALYAATLAANPDATTLRYNQATDILDAGGSLDEAKAILLEVTRRDPHWTSVYKAYNNLGEIARRQGDGALALEYYDKSIAASDRRQADPFINRASYFWEKRQALQALVAACKASQLPGGQQIAGRLDELAGSVREALQKKPEAVMDDVLHGGAFAPSEEKRVTLASGGCDPSGCYFVLKQAARRGDPEILLPYLTVADGAPFGSAVTRPRNVRVDDRAGVIVVELDLKDRRPLMRFYVPSCEGVYYAVGAKGN